MPYITLLASSQMAQGLCRADHRLAQARPLNDSTFCAVRFETTRPGPDGVRPRDEQVVLMISDSTLGDRFPWCGYYD